MLLPGYASFLEPDSNLPADAAGHLGRRHPLSNYTRLCTSCGLILCSLNLPSRPCPSCLASPLLSSQQLLAHKTSQLKRREALIAEGKERYTLATQVEQEEQKRMMFPSLNIAERAGGISEIQRRIDNAYTDNDRRVLTLDLKTKKVMTQTMRKKDSSMPKSKVENLEAELGLDVEPGWIDPTDDGYVNQVRDGKAPPVAPSPAAEIIHYVSKDQGEDSPPEQDDEAADEADQEGHDRPSGPSEVSAAPASRNTETKSSKGQQSKGKGKAVSNADKKDKGKGKERQKVPGQM